MHVMVDPGHGGSDLGAARGSIKESEIVLKVARQLAEMLAEDPRFKVSLTRNDDQKVSLPARTQMAEKLQAELFISIHLNSSPDSKARGFEIYFQNQLPADEDAMFLVSREHEEASGSAATASFDAKKGEPLSVKNDVKYILDDLARNERIQSSSDFSKVLIETLASRGRLQSGRHQIRQAPFQVVSNIRIPSVLVELGFITHPIEGPRLAQEDYQLELAKALYAGILKYKESVDKETSETLKSRIPVTSL
jgi:N-acetylmuramoyl-L-alanine amidase